MNGTIQAALLSVSYTLVQSLKISRKKFISTSQVGPSCLKVTRALTAFFSVVLPPPQTSPP